MHRQLGPRDELRQRLGQRPRVALPAVVEEVLLELVEDQVDLAARDHGSLDGLDEGGPLLDLRLFRDRGGERRRRVLGPVRVHCDDRPLGQSPEIPGHRRAQQRRLPDPARPVQDRQPRRDEVRDVDLALPLAAEEEQPIARMQIRTDLGLRHAALVQLLQ